MDDEPLRLAYANLFPPGSAKGMHGLRGFDIDAFNHFARSINKKLEFVEMRSRLTVPYDQERSPFEGVLGAIENGSILSNLDTNFLTPIRARAFESLVSLEESVELYGGISSSPEDTSLQSFVVFAPSTLAVIALVLVTLRVTILRYGSPSLFIANFLMIYGVFLLMMMHSAFFQGNVSFSPKLPIRTLEVYLPALRSGKIGLVTAYETLVKSDDRTFLLSDHGRLIIEQDYANIASLLCSTSKEYLAVVPSNDVSLLGRGRCQLFRVDPSVLVDGKLQKYELFSSQFDVFFFEKNIPKQWIRKLRYLYNSLYNWDNRLGYFARRYGSIASIASQQAKNVPLTEKNLPTYSPFTLTRMAAVLYVFAGFMAASCIAFILEMIVYHLVSSFSRVTIILPL